MWVSVEYSDFFSLHSTIPRAKIAWVTWRPPLARLHYPELYVGIYEYLRVEPTSGRRESAEEYLASLLNNTNGSFDCPFQTLQRDRIEWVRAWLAELDTSVDNVNRTKHEKFSGKIN